MSCSGRLGQGLFQTNIHGDRNGHQLTEIPWNTKSPSTFLSVRTLPHFHNFVHTKVVRAWRLVCLSEVLRRHQRLRSPSRRLPFLVSTPQLPSVPLVGVAMREEGWTGNRRRSMVMAPQSDISSLSPEETEARFKATSAEPVCVSSSWHPCLHRWGQLTLVVTSLIWFHVFYINSSSNNVTRDSALESWAKLLPGFNSTWWLVHKIIEPQTDTYIRDLCLSS